MGKYNNKFLAGHVNVTHLVNLNIVLIRHNKAALQNAKPPFVILKFMHQSYPYALAKELFERVLISSLSLSMKSFTPIVPT